MSFKRKLQRAADKKGITAEDISKAAYMGMRLIKIKNITVKRIADSFDIICDPDNDYSDNELFIGLCETIAMYMKIERLDYLNFSISGGNIELSGKRLTASDMPIKIMSEAAKKKHLARCVEASAKC